MGNTFFRFKQFTIHQCHTAMKVGTDGCLLGAWAKGGHRILDIGCGTGLVSLMMAQRVPNAMVTAIDIDDAAITDALDNVADSPFSERISIIHSSLQDFDTDTVFDAIVSNPPYYDDSLINTDDSKSIARHTLTITFRDLVSKAYNLLSDEGTFSVIIPTESLKSFTAEACIEGFILLRHTAIRTVERKSPRRHLLEFVKALDNTHETFHEECVLQNSDGTRSQWYAELMSQFYL